MSSDNIKLIECLFFNHSIPGVKVTFASMSIVSLFLNAGRFLLNQVQVNRHVLNVTDVIIQHLITDQPFRDTEIQKQEELSPSNDLRNLAPVDQWSPTLGLEMFLDYNS